MRVVSDIPKEIVDVFDKNRNITREVLQKHGISEYKAKIYSFLLNNGRVDFYDEGEILKSVVLPDIHHPDHDIPCMTAINEFLGVYQPDEIVYSGDQITLDVVSSWNANKPKLIEGARIRSDCHQFDWDILSPHEEICPEARRVFMYGNHEERLRWFVQRVPSVEGLVEVENVLDLEERGYVVVPFNEMYRIGKLKVIHGFYWNKYSAAKTANAFESNVLYCHTHTSQAYTKTNPIDRKDYHRATNIGCLCNLNPSYRKNKPNRWIHEFAVVEVHIETGNFNLYPITINDGVFVWNGRVYDGNQAK